MSTHLRDTTLGLVWCLVIPVPNFSRPFGTFPVADAHPTLKRWAIIKMSLRDKSWRYVHAFERHHTRTSVVSRNSLYQFQPSLRDFSGGGRAPNVETLGYYQMSLRDKYWRYIHAFERQHTSAHRDARQPANAG